MTLDWIIWTSKWPTFMPYFSIIVKHSKLICISFERKTSILHFLSSCHTLWPKYTPEASIFVWDIPCNSIIQFDGKNFAMRPNLRNFHTVHCEKLKSFPQKRQIFRQINSSNFCMPHSVEKYYKTRSRSKNFREINYFVTSLVKTLIWRKNVDLSSSSS